MKIPKKYKVETMARDGMLISWKKNKHFHELFLFWSGFRAYFIDGVFQNESV